MDFYKDLIELGIDVPGMESISAPVSSDNSDFASSASLNAYNASTGEPINNFFDYLSDLGISIDNDEPEASAVSDEAVASAEVADLTAAAVPVKIKKNLKKAPRKDIHKKHRERLREQFLNCDPNDLQLHQLLEMLLFYGRPRVDTNEIAHELLDNFRRFSSIFEANYDELIGTHGIGENTAVLIKLIHAVVRRYDLDKDTPGEQITSSSAAGKYILPFFKGLTVEKVFLVALNGKNEVVYRDFIQSGVTNSVDIPLRTVAEKLLTRNATAAIIAHNHPGAFALPSSDDISSTNYIKDLLSNFGIDLFDHVIVSDNDYVSLKESGFF